MRKFIVALSAIIVSAIIIIACQKENSREKQSNLFDKEAAKEWYYGTFKKSSEWQTSSLKGKKLPDWKNGVSGKIKDYNAVEFLLNKSVKSFSIFSKSEGKTLTSAEKLKVAEASISKILFIKKPDGNIIIREIDYIPDWNYLQKVNFDISHTSVLNDTNDFTGRVEIKEWNGNAVSVSKYIGGKRISTKLPPKRQLGNYLTTEENSCVQCLYERDCETSINGDVITVICGPWRETECWNVPCDDNPPGEEDPCIMYGECGDPGGGTPNQCVNAQAFFNSIVASSTPLSQNEQIVLIDNNASSRTKTYKWRFHQIGSAVSTITFSSKEIGTHSYSNGAWRWQSLTHNSVIKNGTSILWSAECNSLDPEDLVLGDFVAKMRLEYAIQINYVCDILNFETNNSYTSTSQEWSPND